MQPFVAGLGLFAWVTILLLRRARRGRGSGAHTTRRFVATGRTSFDALCAHPRVLARAARGEGAARVVIDVVAVPVLDDSSLALLAAARASLARRRISLELVGCSEVLAAQVRKCGLGALVAVRHERALSGEGREAPTRGLSTPH